MIYNQDVVVTISNNNSYYCEKYGHHKQGDKIVVNVFDLPKTTIRKVKAKCDDCGCDWYVCYSNVSTKSHHRCFSCTRKHVGKTSDQTKAICKNKQRVGDLHPRWNKNKSEFKKYHRLVTRSTNKHKLCELNNYEKRGMAGVDGAYHLDHMVSVSHGFNNNVPPEVIGAKENLTMITWQENYNKRDRCSITTGELFSLIEISHINIT